MNQLIIFVNYIYFKPYFKRLYLIYFFSKNLTIILYLFL